MFFLSFFCFQYPTPRTFQDCTNAGVVSALKFFNHINSTDTQTRMSTQPSGSPSYARVSRGNPPPPLPRRASQNVRSRITLCLLSHRQVSFPCRTLWRTINCIKMTCTERAHANAFRCPCGSSTVRLQLPPPESACRPCRFCSLAIRLSVSAAHPHRICIDSAQFMNA